MADPYPGTPHPEPQHPDDDPTAELPVLSDVALYDAETGAEEDDHPTSEETTILFGAAARELDVDGGARPRGEDAGALEGRVADLSQRWSHLEDQLDRNTATLGSLSEQLADARSALSEGTANERQLNQRLAGKDAELDRLHDENRRLEHDHEALQQTYATLQRDHRTLRHDFESLDQARATLRQELEAEDTRRGELERQQALRRNEWQTQLDAARAAHAALEAELGAARKQVHELREAQRAANDGDDPTAAYRDEIAALSGYIENRRNRWDEMEAQVAAQRQRIGEFETEMAHRVERQHLAEQAAQRETERAAQLKARLSEVASRLDVERRRAPAADAAARRHAELESALDALRTTLSEQRAELERILGDLRGPAPEDAAPILTDSPDGDTNERIAALHRELREQLDLVRSVARVRAEAAEAGTEAAEAGAEAAETGAEAAEAGAEAPEAGAEAAETGATPEPPEPHRSLICLTSEQPRRYELAKAILTIGRSTAADIQVLTHFVSREHARLVVDEESVRIEDVGSTNGVFVNSVRVRDQVLSHGDWITIGESQFRFLSGPAH